VTRAENQEAVSQLFECLQRELGSLAPAVIKIMAECIGGHRLTFPDLQELYRQERNRRIRVEFTGFNLQELGFKYRLHPKQVRRIVNE
jgi:Mor family transcriptional regulator